MAFVVDPKGGTAYSVIEGIPQRSNAFFFLPEGLEALIQASRTQNSTVVGLLRSGADVLMAPRISYCHRRSTGTQFSRRPFPRSSL